MLAWRDCLYDPFWSLALILISAYVVPPTPLPTVLKEIRDGRTTVISADAIAKQVGGRTLRHASQYAPDTSFQRQ